MTENKDFLGTEPVGKLLRNLALPTVAAQLINMLYNIVDRIYIGHIPGEGSMALTGVGVCMPIIMIVSAFAALISSGGAPRASIAMGRGDQKSAEHILGNCFCLQILASAVLTAVLLIWNRDFLMAFGASENTISYAVSYMNIYAMGTIFVQLTLGMNAFITAQGFAKTGMLSVLIGAVLNIVLDPIFIFGLGMGVRGAAAATVLSQAASCIWVLSFLLGKKTVLRIQARYMRLSPKVFLPCMALGLATFIMQSSESVISVCFNSSLLTYGGDIAVGAMTILTRVFLPCMALGLATFIMQSSESVISVCFNSSLLTYGGDIAVGAMTILTSVMQFAMLPLQGLGQGAQPIISYNYGAGNKSRVKKAYFLLLKSSLFYSCLLWGGIMLFPAGFTGIFTSDPHLVEFSAMALRIYMAVMFLFGIQMACQMTFTSLGNAKASITVAVVRKFVLLIPLIYLLPRILPMDQTKAVYLSEPIADTLAVTFTAILFTFQFRKALRELDQKA